MDNHVISNGFISGTIAFFAYLVLIGGLLAAGGSLFLVGPKITPSRVLMAALIAVGSVSSSFPMLAVSRILEKVSAYNPCDVHSSSVNTAKAPENGDTDKNAGGAGRPVDSVSFPHDFCAFCGKKLFVSGALYCTSCGKEQPQNKQQNA